MMKVFADKKMLTKTGKVRTRKSENQNITRNTVWTK